MRCLISVVTDCDSAHERLRNRFKDCPEKYFRFNVEAGLENVGLDHWKKMDEVAHVTERYLNLVEAGKAGIDREAIRSCVTRKDL